MALQNAPLIDLERRILILLYLFVAVAIMFHLMPLISQSGDYFNLLLRGSLPAMIAGLGATIYARHRALDMFELFLTSVTRYPCYSEKKFIISAKKQDIIT